MAAEMREPTYFLLAALLDGPRHGYAIAQAARTLSDGRVRLTAGTLSGALERLVAAGWIEELGEEVVAGRRRRVHGEVLLGLAQDLVDEGASSVHREALGLVGAGLMGRLERLAGERWQEG